jgi:vacuolar-type H+-ATPase subunit E/Vma4
MKLCLLGQDSIPERKIILERRRAIIQNQIDSLNESIKYIDSKQKFYDEVLSGEREYMSNLLPCSCAK